LKMLAPGCEDRVNECECACKLEAGRDEKGWEVQEFIGKTRGKRERAWN